MRKTNWILVMMASAACGAVTAEPILNKSGALDGDQTTDTASSDDGAFEVMSIEVVDTPSQDAYACQIVPDESGADGPHREGDTFIFDRAGGWDGGYSQVCVQAGNGELAGCWGPDAFECGDASRPCELITARPEPGTGETVLAGGRYRVCTHPCTTDADCPAPGSGTAVATCVYDSDLYGFPENVRGIGGVLPDDDGRVEAGLPLDDGAAPPPPRAPVYHYGGGGSCMIGCAGGEACPDGFFCIEPIRHVPSPDRAQVLSEPAPAQCVQFTPITLRQ